MPRKPKKDKPNGHQKSTYRPSCGVSNGGSVRSIRRNQVRRMTAKEDEKMSLKMAWSLLTGRLDLFHAVAPTKSKKAVAKRVARRKAQRQARKNNR